MKVIKKQKNYKLCYVCGVENPFGLKAPFYEMEDHSVVSIFEYKEIHQSYPERVHGGLIAAMLDEIAGRAIWIDEPDTFGVTTQLSVKYRKPVPYDALLKAVGKITRNTRRIMEAHSEIYDSNHQLLAEADVVYFKQPINKISKSNHINEEEIYVEDNVKEINF